MGIKDLMKVLKEYSPDSICLYGLDVFCGYTVAIDISIYLNKFIKSSGAGFDENGEMISSEWLNRFMVMFCKLKKYGIKVVCIFDGPNPPMEKLKEQEKRRGAARTKVMKIDDAKYLLEKVKEDYLPYDTPLDASLKEQIRNVVGKRLQGGKEDISDYDNLDEVVLGLKTAIARYEKQNAPILPIYTKSLKKLLEAFGFNYFVAPGEAEQLCAWMNRRGMVDGVLSEDTDVIAYGAPLMLCKMDAYNNTVTVVVHSKILQDMEFTEEQFLDMCIMLRCDYNKHVNIKGYPYGRTDAKGKPRKCIAIGTKKIPGLIKEYGSLDSVASILENPDDLIYEKCREIFSLPDTDPKNVKIAYDKPINEKSIKSLLDYYGITTPYEIIKMAWARPEIIFPK